jgi:hypothetical protein
VRYLVVAVASVLTSCAGLGSFTTAMNPTQDYCASRGLTFDAGIKQCVVPPPSPQAADTTGSLPAQTRKAEQQSPPLASAPPAVQKPPPQQIQLQPPPADTQQTQFQEKRAGVPIEQDARIKPDSQISDAATEFAHFVRGSGYRCDSISGLAQHAASITLVCNRSTFRYAINRDKDGRWTVAVE